MLSLNISPTTNRGGYLLDLFKEAFTKKRKLVFLEVEAIDRIAAHWQEILQSNFTDRLLAENSIKACYHQSGLAAPSIIWAEHPLNVIKILLNRPDLCDVSDVLIHEFWQSELTIQKSIVAESALQVLTRIEPQYLIENEIGTQQLNVTPDYLNQLVMERVSRLYCELTERQIHSPLQDYNIGILGYFDYFMQIGVEIPRMKPTIDLAKSCGWCWTFDKLAILTPKPSFLKIDRFGKIVGIIYNDTNILSNLR